VRSSAWIYRLLIDAEDDRGLGRVQIEPHDVAHLGDELRVLGELPDVLAVRLEAKGPPDAQDRRLAEPELGRQRARRPVGRSLWRALQGGRDHLLDLGVGDRARPAGAGLIDQPVQALGDKAPAPLTRHRPRDPQPLADLGVLQALGRGQHHPRARRQGLGALAPPRPGLQLLAFLIAQDNGYRSWIGHP
jgi:hypothetical protein